MENQIYGYIRVSSRDQNEDRQVIAMREFGIAEKNLVIDKQSGKDFARPGYRRLLRKLKPNDTLVIKSIDRLGRNYDEVLEQYVAQTEREFIHQRQAEGIAAAKARGVKFGRKPKERPAEYEHLRDEWRAGRISARAASRQLGVAHRTFMKWVEQENSDC